MRNIFKDHSSLGVVLILCSFVFAVFLRVFDLGTLSPWTDELASWYYLRHLDLVFKVESHSPLYYALLRLILGEDASLYGIRMVSALASVAHLLLAFFLGKKVFSPGKFLIFWFLICFNPTDIIFARMARHYSWFLEGILIYVLWIRIKAPTWSLCVVSALMGFVHVFALIPMSLILFWEYLEKRNLKRLLLPLFSSGLVIFYYLARLITLGSQQVARNVSWNQLGFQQFWSGIWLQFFGDAYPRHIFYPVYLPLVLALSFLILGFLLWKSKKSSLLLVVSTILTLIVVEVFALSWINLRVNRYVIYLVPLLIYAIVDSLEDKVKTPVIVAVFAIALGYITFLNPLKTYPWDREKVELWKEFTRVHEGKIHYVCANPYQSAYFDLGIEVPCSENILKLNTKASLIFFDLNLNDRLVLLYLMQEMRLADILRPATNGIFLFEPR
jgi:hypothetical protein